MNMSDFKLTKNQTKILYLAPVNVQKSAKLGIKVLTYGFVYRILFGIGPDKSNSEVYWDGGVH